MGEGRGFSPVRFILPEHPLPTAMPASDYEVTEDDAELWSERAQTEEAQENFQNSGTSANAEKYEENASNAGDDYASGVADYIGADPDEIAVDDDYEDGVDGAGGDWSSGVSGAGERWAEGVEGKQDEYLEGAQGAGQKWFDNYAEGVSED